MPSCHLATIFQKQGETLKDYIARFQKEASNVDNPGEESLLTALSAGLDKSRSMYRSLYKRPVKDLREFHERAAAYIRWEDSFGTSKRKDSGPKKEKKMPDKRDAGRNNGREEGSSRREDRPRNNQATKRPRFEDEHKPRGRFNNYSE